MYLVELFILADKYEDKGFDTCSFRLKIKRLTQYNFYNSSIKDNYYGKKFLFSNGSNGHDFGNGNGNGSTYYRFDNGYDDKWKGYF